jgi:O-acetylhomoserine (thiol)-lyase
VPGFSTLAIHAGAAPDPSTGARVTPIYQTTSYVFNDVEHAAALFNIEVFGNIYSRIGNPTQAVLEQRVAALEGGTAALAVASGHAAQMLVFHTLLEPGDEFVAGRQLYGGSVNQFNHSFKKFNWNVAWADATDPASFEKAITPKTKAIFCESIANPGGVVIDLPAIAKIAKKAGVPFIVDNTLATPYLCRPKEHGADIVVHSLTKFMGGHGNSIGGVIVDCGTFDWLMAKKKYAALVEPNPSYNGMRLAETFGNFAFAIACRVLGLRDLGPAMAPFNAFLILTGIETLPLRMAKHCENTRVVAEHLAGRKGGGGRTTRLADNKYNVTEDCPKCRRRLHIWAQGRLRSGRKAVSNVKLFSHLANIGDTHAAWTIHPARRRTGSSPLTSARRPEQATTSCGCRWVLRRRQI